MKGTAIHLWFAAAFLLATSATGRASEIGWPEAVSRLAGERSRAEVCVALLKGHGEAQQISRGHLAYATAKADSDAVIAGLITALGESSTPESLSSLESRLERSASGLTQLCTMVAALVPDESGQKGVVAEIVKAALEPLVGVLSAGVTALYNNHRKDKALTRQTIQTQLEAAKWPDFADVKAAR